MSHDSGDANAAGFRLIRMLSMREIMVHRGIGEEKPWRRSRGLQKRVACKISSGNPESPG
jgi:hypothetical protein